MTRPRIVSRRRPGAAVEDTDGDPQPGGGRRPGLGDVRRCGSCRPRPSPRAIFTSP